DAWNIYSGRIYEELGRGVLAMRGQSTRAQTGTPPRLVSAIGDNSVLSKSIHEDDWNEVHIIARGNEIVQNINGHMMSMLVDDDSIRQKNQGLVGIQLHAGAPMKVEVRRVRLKKL